MTWLAELFETNRIIVLSVYGQVFFVMGLAIALQSRRRSQLPLARALGVACRLRAAARPDEWGYLFVPIQAGWLTAPAVEALLVLQLLMKPLSFALLFQFGVELLVATRDPERPVATVRGQPCCASCRPPASSCGAVATIVLSTTVGRGLPSAGLGPWLPSPEIADALADVGAPLAVGDVVARYLLAFPAALFVAVALRRTTRQLAPMAGPRRGHRPRSWPRSRSSSSRSSEGWCRWRRRFLPASVLNDQVVLETLGIPIEVFVSVTGLAIAVAIIVSLELFEQETDRALADARRRELLLRERERIGRDLHDGIIQSIYAAGLHLEQAARRSATMRTRPRDAHRAP